MKKFGRVGWIARLKPLHYGGAGVLETACELAEHVIIGIGSCNKYNARNPFTAEESKGMIDALLGKKYSNYSVIFIPDFAHIPEYSDGKKWRQYVVEHFGPLDAFITSNDYVSNLLKNDYSIIPSYVLVPVEKRVKTRATEVRLEMARGGDWQSLVPETVAQYIVQNKFDERFRKEFGLETIARFYDESCLGQQTAEQEKQFAKEA